MQSRALRISMLAFVALWFGVVLPGHQRGAIQLPGYKTAGNSSEACRTTKQHCPACPAESSPVPGKPATPAGGSNSSHCAICFFIGVLDVPVSVTFGLPDYHLLALLSPPACESIAAAATLDTLRERGPPFA